MDNNQKETTSKFDVNRVLNQFKVKFCFVIPINRIRRNMLFRHFKYKVKFKGKGKF